MSVLETVLAVPPMKLSTEQIKEISRDENLRAAYRARWNWDLSHQTLTELPRGWTPDTYIQ